MARIVLIGAGSHIFSRNLITDVLFYPELRDSTITLMDSRISDSVLASLTRRVENRNQKKQGFTFGRCSKQSIAVV